MSKARIRRLLERDRARAGCADCGRDDVELEPDVPLCADCRREIEHLALRQEFSRTGPPVGPSEPADDLPF